MTLDHESPSAEGYYWKFEVRRTDGRDGPGQFHDDCKYFVLDLTHDPVARVTALEYATHVEHFKPNLAADLRAMVKKIRGW